MQSGANFRTDDLARTPTLGPQAILPEVGSYHSHPKDQTPLPQWALNPPLGRLPEPIKVSHLPANID